MAGIFKAYDVRGLYPEQINEDVAHNIGLSLRNVLDEGDPKHRIVKMKGMDPEMYVDGTYQFIDVGSPEHCIFDIKVGAQLPGWIPNWVLEFIANLGANRLSDTMREGLDEEPMWPADRQAPIRTAKGERDRAAWLAKRAEANVTPKDLLVVPSPR